MTTSPERIPYVLLRFAESSRPGERLGFPVLVLARSGSIDVRISPEWETRTRGEYREYLRASTDDWRETPADRIPDLMRDLAALSTGPLQTAETGWVEIERIDEVLQGLSREASGH